MSKSQASPICWDDALKMRAKSTNHREILDLAS
jgi:hypothetical protein